MPDYRLIHRRALRGEKVGALTDFERGVWLAYILIADDFGVMPFAAGELSRAIWLKGKSRKTVQKALDRVRDIGLIQTWTHQGTVYCYADDWQEWQNVRHPRGTIEPCPPTEILAGCKPKTQLLFADHCRISGADDLAQDDGRIAADAAEFRQMPHLARAGRRETLTPTLTANANPNANARRESAQSGGAGAGSYPRDHLRHAWCSERLCVPDFIHAQLVRQRGNGDSETWLKDTWYPAVIARYDGATIALEPAKFWPAEFAAEFKGSQREAVGARAMREWLQS